MFHLKQRLRQRMKWLEGVSGQGLVEYAVILLFVAIAVAAAVGALGQALSNFFMQAVNRFPAP